MTENEIKLIESYKQITQTIKILEIQLDTLNKIHSCIKIKEIKERLQQQRELKYFTENVLDGCVDGWRNYL